MVFSMSREANRAKRAIVAIAQDRSGGLSGQASEVNLALQANQPTDSKLDRVHFCSGIP